MTRFTVTGDAGGAVKAVNDLVKAIAKGDEAFEKTTKKATALDKAAQQIVKNNEGPQEKYNRRIKELADLVNNGKLSFEQADIAARRYAKELEKAGDAGRAAFGDQAATRFKTYVAGIASVTAAVGFLKAAFREAEAAAQSAADNAFASLGAQGEIQQIANNPDQLAQINARAKNLISRGIFAPTERAKAFETVINLQNAGYDETDVEALATLADTGFVSSSNMMELGGRLKKVQNIFGDEAGNIASIIDKVTQAATQTQLSVSEFAGAVPDFGSEAVAAGIKFEEAIAGFIAVEKESPSGDVAKTRMKAFLQGAKDAGLIVNNDLTDTIEALQRRAASGEDITNLFSSVRAKPAAAALVRAGAEAIAANEQGILQSAGMSAARSGTLLDVDPVYRAGKLRETAVGTRAMQAEAMFAEKELLFDVVEQQQRANIERNWGAFGQILSGLSAPGFRVLDWLQLESVAMRAAQGLSSDQNAAVQDYLKRAAQGIERMQQNVTTRQE